MKENLLPTRKNTGKGTPPAAAAPPSGIHDNLSRVDPNALQQVNFTLPHAKKLEMTIYAKERGETLKDMLVIAFDDYKNRNL